MFSGARKGGESTASTTRGEGGGGRVMIDDGGPLILSIFELFTSPRRGMK